MQPKFIYFDLGKVIINFSVDRMLCQVGEVAGLTAEETRRVLFADGLMDRHESGKVSCRELYEEFCGAIGRRPDYQRLLAAAADIFEMNLPVLPIVAQLQQAGYRLGILSNTCETHWPFCYEHYRVVADGFACYALSYEIGAMKPSGEVYRAAAELARVAPEEIFFVDDVAGHVEGARAAGFDAVQFTSAEQLARDLRCRGVRINY